MTDTRKQSASDQQCGHCGAFPQAVLTDAAPLLHTLARRHAEIAAARMQAANLRAAIQAALGAAEDGEPDPLAFLRWELAGQPADRGRR